MTLNSYRSRFGGVEDSVDAVGGHADVIAVQEVPR